MPVSVSQLSVWLVVLCVAGILLETDDAVKLQLAVLYKLYEHAQDVSLILVISWY